MFLFLSKLVINEDEPPVKKGRSVKSKKLDEVVQAATVTRTRSTSSRAKKQETIQVETEPAVRRSNRKSK